MSGSSGVIARWLVLFLVVVILLALACARPRSTLEVRPMPSRPSFMVLPPSAYPGTPTRAAFPECDPRSRSRAD